MDLENQQRIIDAAEKFGAEPGVWLSPWGGYGPPRKERLAAAKAGGYEVDDQGIAGTLRHDDCSAQECVDTLIAAALDGGGSDNVTVVLVRSH